MLRFLLPAVWVALCGARCPSGQVTYPDRADAGVGVTLCEEACTVKADCLQGYDCLSARCLPQTAPPTCSSHLECMGRMAGWRKDCVDDASCVALFACVGDTTQGWCARKPSTGTPCSQTGQEDVVMQEKDGTGPVTVCGIPRARCSPQGTCFTGCLTNADCSGETPHCNTQSGLCECTSSTCRTNASVCTAGTCHCARDADCTHNADKCVDGACTCTGALVCREARAHPSTHWVCE